MQSVEGPFDFSSQGFVLQCFRLGLHELLPEGVALVCFHKLSHGLLDLLRGGARLRDVHDQLALVSLLLHDQVHHFVELLWLADVCLVDLAHEVVQVVNNLVLHILEVLDLGVDLVQSVRAGIVVEQGVLLGSSSRQGFQRGGVFLLLPNDSELLARRLHHWLIKVLFARRTGLRLHLRHLAQRVPPYLASLLQVIQQTFQLFFLLGGLRLNFVSFGHELVDVFSLGGHVLFQTRRRNLTQQIVLDFCSGWLLLLLAHGERLRYFFDPSRLFIVYRLFTIEGLA